MRFKNLIFIVLFIILSFALSIYLNKKTIEVESEVVDNKISSPIKVVEEESASATLVFVGDIMLSRGVEYVAPRYKELNFPFQYIEKTLNAADLTIGNLETPITKKGPYMVPYSLVFNSNPKYLERLKSAGFDILSSANNHALDKGESGLKETIQFIKSSRMESVGASLDCHKGLVKDVNGIKFGFLAYSYTAYNSGGYAPSELVCDWNDFESVKSDVKNLRPKVDYMIILPHTGIEYSKKPTKQDEEKMKELIDVGASAVVSAHPHVVQSVEKYKDRVIAYSLGNFVFDNQENPDAENGLMLRLVFDKESLQDVEELPIKINNFCCPTLVNSQ